MTLDDNSVTILIGESDFDVRAVITWAGKVVTFDIESGSFRILGYTISWINRCDFWTIIENEISTNVLPVLIVLVDFNNSLTSIF
jgi:hypothetical protein